MHIFIWFILCLFAFVGCRTQRSLSFGEGQGVGVVVPDTTALPTFPAEARTMFAVRPIHDLSSQ